ncbi:MAG: ATP-binding cassette domain-containing protein [Acidobacteria bacterium]|nr:ATP-binding cassette domain-containing protein [Acidobacteriota bacterium]
MVSCSNLVKRFGRFTAVDDVSFRVERGTICALIGANGAGKTTTLGMLTGMLLPTAGRILVAGASIEDDPVELRRRTGVVPDSLGLFDALTVEEHLRLSASVYGLEREVARRRCEDLLALLSLDSARRRFAADCSHGMRKKLALALAVLHNPAVLFLDEPFEGMDPVAAETVRHALGAAARRGTTVLFTSHSLNLVERLADQVVFIHHGRVALDRPISDLPKALHELYFETLGQPDHGRMEWLGSPQS